MPLTPQERNFVDHLDHEAFELTSRVGVPIPATSWLTAHRVTTPDIVNILNLRRVEREGPPWVPDLTEPYAPAWKTGEEAKERNRELEGELQDAKALRPR